MSSETGQDALAERCEIVVPVREPFDLDRAFDAWANLISSDAESGRARLAAESLRIRMEDDIVFNRTLRTFLKRYPMPSPSMCRERPSGRLGVLSMG